ncbi:hypothetical protein KFE25_005642 [Diacronema lutheri]|uniref:Beta-carotene isomerase D27-like C-terminal domain-containing protein n=1 Tax=Diacronema lutheri TaxID=2081491 RepID=A0A8J6C933_DIALT|nr:hypothetical protein KFE25_005642 [Diacronema lutheri]
MKSQPTFLAALLLGGAAGLVPPPPRARAGVAVGSRSPLAALSARALATTVGRSRGVGGLGRLLRVRRTAAPAPAPAALEQPAASGGVQPPEELVDDPFMLFMIAAFRIVVGHVVGYQARERFVGGEPGESYRGLVDVSRRLLAHSPEATTERVLGVLRMFPTQPQLLRPSRFWFELMAMFTPLLFPFLVGRCRPEPWVHPSGAVWTTRVKIEKCRFLEGAGCKGMCIGLCKQPTELFFNRELGLPVSLVPNFEDGSCTMTWGEPAFDGDMVGQDLSCYATCPMSGTAAVAVAMKAHSDAAAPAGATRRAAAAGGAAAPCAPPLLGPVRAP